jgi:hypothetical protein
MAESSNSNFGKPTITSYANANGAAQWLLTAAGALTYTLAGTAPPPAPVPLPAAVWLLMSSLVGLGAVSRRRASSSQLAAA